MFRKQFLSSFAAGKMTNTGVKKIPLFILLLSLGFGTSAQTYSFKNIIDYDKFEVQPVNDGVYCLFRISERKAPVSVFKKVFLNNELKPVDSINYSIEGNASLLASCSDEKFVTHVFYSSGSVEKIIFIITDFDGKVQSTFSKTAADFSHYFPKPIKKLKNIQLSFLPNNGSPGMLLLQPYQLKGSSLQKGAFFSLNTEGGKEMWISSSVPPLYHIQTTGSLLFGLNSTNPSSLNSFPDYKVYIVDKETGKMIRSVPFTSKGNGYRLISVFATNGHQLLIAGSEFESGSTKDGRFYMTQFTLDGDKILDEVDSSTLLSTRRLHLMGSVFDQDGNLVLIGEGWKPDATRAIATTAGGVALALLTRGAYVRVYSAGIDHKIENVTFATLSPENGKLKSLKVFPVGPWLTYGRLMTEGGFVLLQVKDQVIIYDVNDPNHPPSPFTSLRTNESLILTPSGPIINKKSNGHYTLRRAL
ncbi:MAG TPA: hypothetical protein VGQ59_06530 [Cyclobacteriaceae bacterium]|nr:hypothetical protein [Cyclobacteriaceae bacterium]